MLYHIAHYLTPYYTFFNVVHYVSFRSLAALITSLLISLLCGNWFINRFADHLRAKAREYAPEHHKAKDNLPTMGGIFILCVVSITTLLWCNVLHQDVLALLGCLIGFGLIGAADDIQKIRRSKGMRAKTKFCLQVLVAALVVTMLLKHGLSTEISIPFFKTLCIDAGMFFVVWAIFIIVGCSNAVNLTDGLDGLAIGSLIPNFATYGIIAYLAGNCVIADYLHIPFAQSAEASIVAAALLGSSIGFLWYNTYPAQIFMGDVGSLALGAVLALLALISKQELVLPLAGGLFLIETLSVIIQVLSYKFLGRRIFKMAPIHHHFELMGWPESRITVRFGIISFILCLCALMTLKLR